jgi:hypothetical protein
MENRMKMQVVEKQQDGETELVQKGYNKKLLRRYIGNAKRAAPFAVFTLRAARPTDELESVECVNDIVILRR